MPEDTSDCRDWGCGGSVTGIYWVDIRDAAKYSGSHRTVPHKRKNCLAPNVNSVAVGNPL